MVALDKQLAATKQLDDRFELQDETEQDKVCARFLLPIELTPFCSSKESDHCNDETKKRETEKQTLEKLADKYNKYAKYMAAAKDEGGKPRYPDWPSKSQISALETKHDFWFKKYKDVAVGVQDL